MSDDREHTRRRDDDRQLLYNLLVIRDSVVTGIVLLSEDVRTQTEHVDYLIAGDVYPLVIAVFGALAVTFQKLALTTGIALVEVATVNILVDFLNDRLLGSHRL